MRPFRGGAASLNSGFATGVGAILGAPVLAESKWRLGVADGGAGMATYGPCLLIHWRQAPRAEYMEVARELHLAAHEQYPGQRIDLHYGESTIGVLCSWRSIATAARTTP